MRDSERTKTLAQNANNIAIDILLAACNSALYLTEAIESVLAQDYGNWRLLIRDGGSKDDTLQIVNRYVRTFPDRIILIHSDGPSPACANFSALLSECSAPYVMFCDHDDIWLPDKISRSIRRFREEEDNNGSDKPLLLFTDKKVVDSRLEILCDSCFQYQNLKPQNIQFNRLLVQNVPSGCTMMINRALAELAVNIPDRAVMHDHWISLIAAAFGKIICLDEPTVLYRQHGGNIYGASRYGGFYFLKRMCSDIRIARNRFYRHVEQAHAFLNQFRPRLSEAQIRLLSDFTSLQEASFWNRRGILMRHKIFKTGLLRNLGMFVIV